MKKIIAILLCVFLIISNMIISVQAEGISPYEPFSLTLFDSSQTSRPNFAVTASYVGALWGGVDWLCYKNMDFGANGPYAVDVGAAMPNDTFATAVELRIDAPDGKLIASIEIEPNGSWMEPTTFRGVVDGNVTGVHDLYLTFDKMTANIFDMCFFAIDPDKFTYPSYKQNRSYADMGNDSIGHAADLMAQLDLMPKDDTDILDAKLPAKRGDFADSIYRVYEKYEPMSLQDAIAGDNSTQMIDTGFSDVPPDSTYAESIKFLSELGIMNGVGNNEFKPMQYMTIMDAVTVVIRMLGYSDIAESEGGYPNGYTKMASKLKLKTGNADYSAVMRRGNMAMLLYSALQAKYLKPIGVVNSEDSDYMLYEEEKGILGQNQKTYFSSGMVEATGVSTLTLPESGLRKNQVSIDDVLYDIGNTDVVNLLGHYCDFFYEEIDNELVLRAIAPAERTKITEIIPQNEKIYITDEKITWCAHNSDKEKKFEISSDTIVIYNGVVADDTITALVDYENSFSGVIRIVENHNERDVVVIEEYSDYIVESISVDETKIFTKNIEEPIELGSSDNILLVEDRNGEDTTLSKFAVDELITVLQSKNKKGPKLTRIFVGENEVYGTVNKIEDSSIYIDGQEYSLSNHWIGGIKVGQTDKFRINLYGNIVALGEDALTAWKTGLYLDSRNNTVGFDNVIKVKLITADGKKEIYTLTEKPILEGVRFSNEDNLMKSVTNGSVMWVGFSNLEKETAIRYCLNKAGEISKIDTINLGVKNHNDQIKRICISSPDKLFRWHKSGRVLINKTTDHIGYCLEPNALVFAFLDLTGSVREDSCFVGTASSILYHNSFEIDAELYSLTGNDYEADILVWPNFSNLMDRIGVGTNATMVYTGRVHKVNEAGENVEIIKGWNNGELEYELSPEIYSDATSKDTLDNLMMGDVLNLSVFPETIIRKVSLRLSCNGEASRTTANGVLTPTVSTSNRSNITLDLAYSSIYGTVVEKTDKYIVVDTGNGEQDVVMLTGGVSTVFSGNGGQVLSDDFSHTNISVDDVVYAHIKNGVTEFVVIYDEVSL